MSDPSGEGKISRAKHNFVNGSVKLRKLTILGAIRISCLIFNEIVGTEII